jgi:transglycosylase, SLT family
MRLLKHELRKRRAKHRRRSSLLLALGVVFGAFFAYFLSQNEHVQRRYLYPYPYQDLVELYANANGVDSALIASVIMNESRFKNDVHSQRGAVGLMQIMPETAKWIAHELGDEAFSLERLHEPETNIRYGVWYLAELKREFAGNDILTLAAYNAGRGTVKEWMEEGGWPWTFRDVDKIPYPETRSYVKNVLQNRIRYERLYPVK